VRLRVLALITVGALALGPAQRARAAQPAPVVAAYFADWDSGYDALDIPASRLTDVIYAFGAIDAAGRCTLGDRYADVEERLPGESSPPYGELGELRRLEALHPHLRSEISIGGAGGSGRFSAVAASPASRAAFATSCVRLFLRDHPGLFDGIDIDWEFPVAGGVAGTPARPADRADATALLAQLRSQLDALGRREHRHLLLTVAMPAGRFLGGPGYAPETSWDLAAVAGLVDWMNVMTYDMTGGASPVTGFDSPLRATPGDPTPPAIRDANTVAATVRYYEAHGVPASEIVLGNAFYGHSFAGVHSRDHGLFQPFRALGSTPTYAQIRADLLGRQRSRWDRYAREPWLYLRASHTFIAYDDPRSLAAKARFVVAHGLRGAFAWEISMDDSSDSLLDALSGPILARASNSR
jgi:chitinase